MVNNTFVNRDPSSPLAGSPIPLYLQLAEILRGRINRREWPAGALIPTLEALAAEFKVARVTARQAVQLLAREGRLAPRRGFGTVVTKADDAPNIVVMKTSLESLAAMYASTSTQVHTFDAMEAGDTIKTTASALRINPSNSRRQSSSLGRSRVSILGLMPRASSAATRCCANRR